MDGNEKTAESAAEKPAGDGGKQAESERAKAPTGLRVAILLLVAFVAILVLRDIASDDGDSDSAASGAEIVSVEELREEAAESEAPIYWAGEEEGELELSRTEDGRTYVRYMAEGDDPESGVLTVGTYPFPDAAAALRKLGREPDAVLASTPDGAVVYFSRKRPQNIYIAHPGEDFQVEVFDVDPKRTIGLVTSGQIVPVG